MFAVIKTGGKQYRVAANDVLNVEKLEGAEGDIVEFGEVLAVGVGEKAEFGAPLVAGAMVTAEIVRQLRDRKVLSFKKRRRQNSKRKRGHRQHLTAIRVAEILVGGAKPAKKAAARPVAEKAPKAEAAAPLLQTAPKAETKKPEPKAEAKKPEPKAAPAKAAIVDDITLIGGVGPAIRKKLEAAGITSLKQIAAMDGAALEKLDDNLKLGGRTAREEWVEQAKELLAGKPPRAKVDRKAKSEE
jgi:large subunit ribosomal protein L21